ncbi:hypothetical protein KCTC52924_01302 [Arenibacter antarcticus]|uniref:Lipoprotein n=1 Tax=Arenibacter antarcticus TaxID=2040469 RepID=A0ABW5V969_9FLAO|nr:hypothetical protein [Arenibacter sp. H213]MCM4167881.1 hypothetical protein [Arenibacter sp. H213]
MSKISINLKNVFFTIMMVLILFSCNSRNKNVGKDYFKITLIAKVLEDDKFQVFYTDEKNKGYTENKRISTSVNKSQDFQEIPFLLNTIPLKFRIDLGENGHKSFVEIEKVILDNGNAKIELNSKVLHRFFKGNIYTEKVDNGYYRSDVEGRYDPFITSTALLEKKIELELK